MTLYSSSSECPAVFGGRWRWQNFSAVELSCPCCGEYWHDPVILDAIQRVRTAIANPITINSAHRCPIHNAHVGGAALSEHKRIALDISLYGQDRMWLLKIAEESGFTTFGFYNTFLHMDLRPGRRWFGKGAVSSWKF